MMRITPQLIVGLVLVVVLGICCLVTWSSGSAQRATGSAWRQSRRAQVADDPVNSLEATERFLELQPGRAEVRLQLAGMYLGLNQTREAVAHYRQIADDKELSAAGGKKAADRLRALAMVMLGTIEARDGVAAKDESKRSAAFAAAKARFEDAVRIEFPEGLGAAVEARPAAAEGPNQGDDPPEAGKRARPDLVAFGDACAGLGLLALWADDFASAEKWFAKALSGRSVLGLEVIPEIHNGMGLVHAAKGEPALADAQFDLAKRYRPKWDVPDRNKQVVKRGLAASPEMPAKQREELLQQVAQTLKGVKNPGADVLNLLGCGYHRLENTDLARSYLEAAVQAEPDSAAVQLNLLAVRWKILCERRAELLKHTQALFPENPVDPSTLYWTTPLARQGVAPKVEEARLVPYRKVQAGFDRAEDDFDASAAWVLQNAKDLPDDQAKALILIRLEAMPRVGRRLAASKDEKVRLQGRDMLASLEPTLDAALKKHPGEPRLCRLKGLRLLAAGEVKPALPLFAESVAAEADQPDIRAVQAVFAGEPEVVGFRPLAVPLPAAGPLLARSGRPVLGAVFRVHTGTVPLAADRVKVKLDGREVTGTFWGTEFLVIPDNNLADGEHRIEAEAEDLLGRRVSGSFQFLVDDSPPEITRTEPGEQEKVAGPRPKLVVHYSDKYSGVDPASVEIELRSGAGASTWLKENPVRGGRYTFDYPGLGIVKGASVGADQAVFCPTRDLGSGNYIITVSVQDVRGLAAKKIWTFGIK